ncbi:MAG: hypothetical protein IMF11_01270 [Proteobacteria bacterium]|nr:hypothetical protein [Pseudomonadota bacterium]
MPGAPEKDYWFWEKLTAPATSKYSINIHSPASDQGEATVRICFRGRSTASPHPNHHTIIFLNGTEIGSATWDGDGEYVQEMTISPGLPGLIDDGANTLGIKSPGDTGAAVDIIYYNWIEIDYRRYFEAVENKLTFTINGDERLQIEIKKLSQQDIRIYDITDPDEVKEVVNFSIQPDGLDYKAIFEDQVTGARTYYVLTISKIMQPDSITLWEPENLKSTTNGADYIVITAREFLPSVEPLCQLRQSQGLRVKAVSVEDIYNEFNYGLFDPEAIKDFLKYACENWDQPAPTYVLLVGDANTDYRDYLGTGKENKVPVHLSITLDLGLTPGDNWYVCVQGDDVLPDMFIGRIPGASHETVADVVEKIVNFEASDYEPESVLFVADDNDTEFEALNEDLIGYLPDEFSLKKVYLRLYEDVDDATQDIISGIDEGMMITNYVGHGAVTNWAGEFMFESPDVASLNNTDKLTFAITLTCLNGYFSHPFYYSLGEEFVAAPDKGAIASFSPGGLGYQWEHEILGKEVFKTIFEEKNNILGSITTQSKIAAYAHGVSGEMLETFTLIGDPGTRLKGIWQNGDIDGDGSVGLEDAIIVLKILAGIRISQFINMSADVNNDGRIGLAEVVYVLQHLSGARP